MKCVPAFMPSVETLPAMLRLTKYGTCAFTFPFCMSWTTCQPPSPSGTVIVASSASRSAVAVAVPSGTETKLQHVPVQLTRFPTTVDHSSSTGAFGTSPDAVRSTLE